MVDVLVTLPGNRRVFGVSEPIEFNRTALKDYNANVKSIKHGDHSQHCIDSDPLYTLLNANSQYEQANYKFDQNSDKHISDLSKPFPQKRFLMLICWYLRDMLT